jgi:hypothetical protein
MNSPCVSGGGGIAGGNNGLIIFGSFLSFLFLVFFGPAF